MLQFRCIITTIALFFYLVSVAPASQEKSVEDSSATAGKMLNIIQQLQFSLQEDSSIVELRKRLIQEAEKLQVCQPLLDVRIRSRETRLKNGNSTVRGRHEEFSVLLNQCPQDIDDLLQRVVVQSSLDQEDLKTLSSFLKQFVLTKQGLLHGSAPYRDLQTPTVAPRISPLITPACQIPKTISVSAGPRGALEAPISQAIYQQTLAITESAGKQNWDPVDLYEFVKNNIRTEWYWGSMKGAEEILVQLSSEPEILADQETINIITLMSQQGRCT